MNISIPGQCGMVSTRSQPVLPTRQALRISAKQGRWPPGKIFSRMKSVPFLEGKVVIANTNNFRWRVQCGEYFSEFLQNIYPTTSNTLIRPLLVASFHAGHDTCPYFGCKKAMVSIQPIPRLDVTSISGNLDFVWDYHHPVGIPIRLIALIWNANGLDGHFSAGL